MPGAVIGPWCIKATVLVAEEEKFLWSASEKFLATIAFLLKKKNKKKNQHGLMTKASCIMYEATLKPQHGISSQCAFPPQYEVASLIVLDFRPTI